MEMEVRERVHIMPVGYEFERIVRPAQKFRADRIVLIRYENESETGQGQKYWNEVIEALEDEEITVQPEECDLFDLYSSLGAIAQSISQHSNDDVYVNVSTGSKVTAIAGMIASMVMDATAYYVKAEDYEGDSPSKVSSYSNLPQYPIDAPDKQQLDVMMFIEKWTYHKGPPTKGEVIHYSEQESLPFVRQNVAGKGKYRLLDTHIVEPLKQRGWIDETKQGRNKILTLTSNGENALQAFRWMVDGIDWEKYLDEETDGNSE